MRLQGLRPTSRLSGPQKAQPCNILLTYQSRLVGIELSNTKGAGGPILGRDQEDITSLAPSFVYPLYPKEVL